MGPGKQRRTTRRRKERQLQAQLIKAEHERRRGLAGFRSHSEGFNASIAMAAAAAVMNMSTKRS